MKMMRFVLTLAVALAVTPAFAQAPAPAAKPADSMQILREKLKGGKSLATLMKETSGHARLLANELFVNHGVLPYFGDRHTSESARR